MGIQRDLWPNRRGESRSILGLREIFSRNQPIPEGRPERRGYWARGGKEGGDLAA